MAGTGALDHVLNSRALPGHEYVVSVARVSGGTLSGAWPDFSAILLMKCSTNSGMSNGRSRRGGMCSE